MKRIGELIEETIEASEGGATERAFALTCEAIEATLLKSLATDALSATDYQNFIKRHWRLLSFTGLPAALPLPLAVDHKIKAVCHGFRISGAEELVVHLVQQTARMGRLPAQFIFHQGGTFDVRGNQILVPARLIAGLVGVVIFQPINKDETVPEKYWINVSDFKMFISEFWGRIDLAERIMDFYQN